MTPLRPSFVFLIRSNFSFFLHPSLSSLTFPSISWSISTITLLFLLPSYHTLFPLTSLLSFPSPSHLFYINLSSSPLTLLSYLPPLSPSQVVDINNIEEGWMGLDIGPKTLADIQAGLADCKTVIWNGPMGTHCTKLFTFHEYFCFIPPFISLIPFSPPFYSLLFFFFPRYIFFFNFHFFLLLINSFSFISLSGVFEFDAFSKGTFGIATTLAELTSKGCITIIGGGGELVSQSVDYSAVQLIRGQISTLPALYTWQSLLFPIVTSPVLSPSSLLTAPSPSLSFDLFFKSAHPLFSLIWLNPSMFFFTHQSTHSYFLSLLTYTTQTLSLLLRKPD